MPLPPTVLAWVGEVVGGKPGHIEDLGQSTAGPWLVTVGTAGGPTQVVVSVRGGDDSHQRRALKTEATALGLAAQHGAPAPVVVAVDEAEATDHLVLVTSKLTGSSTIPLQGSAARLRSVGAALARLHGVRPAQNVLPVRAASLEDVDFTAAGGAKAEGALAEAVAVVRDGPAPDEPHVLVHGDLWQGNMMWDGETLTGFIDWDYAGVGPAGIDLGSLRCDVAMMYGLPAPDYVLAGYEAGSGGPVANLAWWDLIAAVGSPPDLGGWLPNFHAQGRADLDLETVTARREAFIVTALQQV